MARLLLCSSLTLTLLACAGDSAVQGTAYSPAQSTSPDAGAPTDPSTTDAATWLPSALISDAGNTAMTPGAGSMGAEGDSASCAAIEKTAELKRGPVDIILALDTSGSMADEVCNVSKNLTTFANGIGDTARLVSVYRMDLDLSVLAQLACGQADPLASTALASDANRYLHVEEKVNSHDALNVLLDRYDSYASFLRPDAPTHIVVVTDDTSDLAGSLFAAQMESDLGHAFFFHAIVADGQNGCSGSGIGTDYLNLADQTGGQKLPICASDWSVLFGQLKEAVVESAPLPCDFEIPPPPEGETLDPEAVRVVFTPSGQAQSEFPRAEGASACGERSAWYYNDLGSPKRIALCPAACTAVKSGGAVALGFGCAPQVIELK